MVYIAVYIFSIVFLLNIFVNLSKGNHFPLVLSAYITIIFNFRNSLFVEVRA